jgi:hypothetical protein
LYKKTIHQIAGLLVAFVMVLGSSFPTQAAATSAGTGGPSIYWGALINGKVPSTTNLQGVFNTFETRSNKKMSIIHWGQPWVMPDGSWGEFQTGYFNNVRNHGSIPMINWDSQKLGAGINQADFQLRDVYNGNYDTYIRRWATDAKNWGHPFFLYFDPEMNGWWSPWAEGKTSNGAIINGNSPGDYVKAWRHVHDIFASVGATNVSWVWAPNHMSTSSQYPALSTLFPGNDYVDWTGLSVYNKYNTWAGLHPLLTGSQGMTWFRNSYQEVLNLAPNKPMMLAQWASNEAGDGGAKKAAWITDALTVQLPVNFPKIKAVVWLNWMETPNETYPIESSQAATNAWAAGIALPAYATNIYANLNISPIPEPDSSYSISGSTGVGDVTLSYVDGTAKTVISQGNGSYSLVVPGNWTGTVTPSHPCYTFSPASRPYSNVNGNQAGQNFSPSYNPASGCLDFRTSVGGVAKGIYGVEQQGSQRLVHPGTDGGPVKAFSGDGSTPILASERFIYSFQNSKSYAEVIGYPENQLATEYWFPWYNNINYSTQLRVSNMGGGTAQVKVYAGGSEIDSFSLGSGQGTRLTYDGLDNGPLHVVSTDGTTPILASERFIQTFQTSASYSEMMGYPGNQLTTEYWFPWYNNVSYSTQLRVSNLGTGSAQVKVYAGGNLVDTFTLAAGDAKRAAYPGLDDGPLQVVSTDGTTPILASERFIYTFGSSASYAEMMGYPDNQLATQYCFPWYNTTGDNDLLLSSQLRISNMGGGSAQIKVNLAGTQIDSFSLGTGQGARKTYAGYNNGPLCVVSADGTTPILASERFISTYGSSASYSEMMGFAKNRLDDIYWFPWYNNISYQTELRIAQP